MFQLAEMLHKTVEEIGRMDSRELSGWLAYLRIKADEREKELVEREKNAGLQTMRRRGFRG
jgi:hypothetical protein